MGYTHYVTVSEALDDGIWRTFINEAKRLLKALPERATFRYWDEAKYRAARVASEHGIVGPKADCMSERETTLRICGPRGTGKPILNGEGVCFNGDGTEDLDFEGFVIERTGCRTTCKTEKRPYDLAVCVVMLSLAHHFPGKAEIGSDGDLIEWATALDLYTKVTGRRPPMTGVHRGHIERVLWLAMDKTLGPLMSLADDPETVAAGVRQATDRILRDLPKEFEYQRRKAEREAAG